MKSLRDHIGIVRQEPLVFQESVRYNVRLGKPNATDVEIWMALQHAHVAHVIRELPDGLDSVIGENGMSLSDGQLQRISIARIFLKNPKIVIFDEATSSLDHESEKMIHQALEDISKERTILIVAYRLSSVLTADRVLVMSDGQIVGQGTHQELLNANTNYQALFTPQYRDVI